MKRTDAVRVLAPIVALHGEWSPEKHEVWIRIIAGKPDVAAAERATRRLIESCGRLPFLPAQWIERYDAEARARQVTHVRALPAAPRQAKNADEAKRMFDRCRASIGEHHDDHWQTCSAPSCVAFREEAG